MQHPLRILCFHRVVPALQDDEWPWRLRKTVLTSDEFRKILGKLSRQFRFVDETTVADTLTELANGKVPSVPMCWVTFDDGYRDNLTVAAPIIEEFGIRPTLFVTTAILDGGWRLPVDRWYSVVATARRADVCSATPESQPIVDLSRDEFRNRWVDGPEKRAFVIATPDRQQEMLARLAAELGGDPDKIKLDYLTVHDLHELSRRGWNIGPHGHRHLVLTEIPDLEIDREILTSAQVLHSCRLATSRWYCYANGATNDSVAATVRRLLVPGGYFGALTVERRDILSAIDPWQAPRHILTNQALT